MRSRAVRSSMAGVHENANRKVARNVVAKQKKQKRAQARERAGLRVKHQVLKKNTAGPARTGKAARKALKADRRAARAALAAAGELDVNMAQAKALPPPEPATEPAPKPKTRKASQAAMEVV